MNTLLIGPIPVSFSKNGVHYLQVYHETSILPYTTLRSLRSLHLLSKSPISPHSGVQN